MHSGQSEKTEKTAVHGFIYCGTHGLLRDVPLNNVQDFERSFIESLQLNHQEDVLDVLRTGVIDDNVTKAIEETAAMVAKQYL